MLKLFVAGLIAVPLAVHAEPWRIEPSVLVGVENFDYHEDVPLPTKSAHEGNQPATRLEVSIGSPRLGPGQLIARAWFGYTGGTMPFDGTDQTGHPITPTGDATGHMTDSELDLGYVFALHGLHVGASVGIGFRTWDRDLRPIGSGGYREDYSWLTVPITAIAEYRFLPVLTAGIAATLLLESPGSMRLHLSDFDPTYADLDLDLKNRPGLRLRGHATYAIAEQIDLVAELTFEKTSMDNGPGTQILVNGAPTNPPTQASEPPTETRRLSLLAGVGYRF